MNSCNTDISGMINNYEKEEDEEEEFTSWQLEDFEIGDCLGNGKFGYVYRAKEKKTNKEVALKVICKNIVSQFNFHEQLKNEIEIHARLIHKNIVRMYGYFYDNSYVYLVYECLKKGNLFQFMKNVSKLNENEAAEFVYQIAHALLYLKKRNIIHRDLKLENVMLAEEDENNITNNNFTPNNNSVFLKLVDFGWASQYFSEFRRTLCGTPEYLAPEMVNSQPYDYQVDIWSLGIMTYEMVTGYSPFSGVESDIINKIKSFEGLTIGASANSIKTQLDEINASEDLINFIDRLLIPDHTKRIAIEEVFVHPWILKNVRKSN